MRLNIVHQGADELTYEIRGIVEFAKEIEKEGVPIFWENIGDPVAKGEKLPLWVKEIVKKHIDDDSSFAYGPTKGLLSAREFLSKLRNSFSGTTLSAEDIMFFNGLGDAIATVYTYLNRTARVIGPVPAYPTHSSAEAAHAGAPHLTYLLQPERNWLPDINDLYQKVHYNPNISGILIINPDNPTGVIYPKRVLEEIVRIAREHDLFIISDEIYGNLSYGNEKAVPLGEVIGEVPGIAMRGISKEFPWPGARCGWIEVYNRTKDPLFARYIQTILDAKMLEVCATTLPQRVLPEVMGDKRYQEHLNERSLFYAKRADWAYKTMSKVSSVIAPKPEGAFYFSVVFKDGILKDNQSLPIANPKVRALIEEKVKGAPLDKRFAYYLLGAYGICVVPLSGFNSPYPGFRMTLLEQDEATFQKIYTTVAEAIATYTK
jgi:aspartate/methionine/tyrosine aminotransferase